MNNAFVSQEQRDREKALYLYLSAFERGDFAAMDPILQLAEHDVILEQMIVDAHDYYLVEEKFLLQANEQERVRELLLEHLPSGIYEEHEAIQIPPLTVEDVMTRLQQDQALPQSIHQEVQDIRAQRHVEQQQLPPTLTLKSVYQLFERLGVSVSGRLQKLFREKAIFLSMAREQGIAQLAATRHQQQRRRQQKQQHTQEEQ